MSYPRDLNEYLDSELEAERQRRFQLRKEGRCPYCEQYLTSPPCRYPEIHKPLRVAR